MKHIMAAVAAGSASLITAKYAIYLAKILQVKLSAVYVVDEKTLQELLKSRIFVAIEAREYEIDLEQQGRYFLERVRLMAESKKVEFEAILLRGVIHEEVINKIKELSADLLVMGDLKEVLSWKDAYSEGERIFRECPCPVVLVKNPQEVERIYKEL